MQFSIGVKIDLMIINYFILMIPLRFYLSVKYQGLYKQSCLHVRILIIFIKIITWQ